MSSKLEADFGVGWFTMILGVGGGGSRSGLADGTALDLIVLGVGGGDARRFVLERGGGLPCFCVLRISPANSELIGDVIRFAVPAAASALWIAAAEGVSAILYGTFWPRCGLWSELFFLDLDSLEVDGCWSFGVLDLIGEGSRDVLGDAARDEEAEAKGPVLGLLGFCVWGGEGDLCERIVEAEAPPAFRCSFRVSAVVASST